MEGKGRIELPKITNDSTHNAHMFYIKVKDVEERSDLIFYLKGKNIHTVFHYIPLHGSPAGKELGRFHGKDRYTTRESERLLRFPLYYGLEKEAVEYIAENVKTFMQ